MSSWLIQGNKEKAKDFGELSALDTWMDGTGRTGEFICHFACLGFFWGMGVMIKFKWRKEVVRISDVIVYK